jgi:predicted  nucleic acid-binding Zn-ribbon protein
MPKKEADLETLSRIMLGEFKRVHRRFDGSDARLDAIANRATNIETELRDIRTRLDHLEEAAKNVTGFTKEIDHLLQRVGAIEKHLGLQQNIKA